MELSIISFYCLADDLFKAMFFQEDSQVIMNNAEVVTVAFTAALFFAGSWEKSRRFLVEYGYIPHMLSKSRLCRRLHAIPQEFWQRLPLLFLKGQQQKEFIVDSFPIPACDNIRIPRRHLFSEEKYRGKCVSKRRYFLGLKAHVLMTVDTQVVEWVFTPGCESDPKAFGRFHLHLPKGSSIYADAVYTHYEIEDTLLDAEQIRLYAQRKSNTRRKRAGWTEFMITTMRKKIESAFSLITSLFPKHIHAVTNQGFALKCAVFIVAFSCWRAFSSS